MALIALFIRKRRNTVPNRRYVSGGYAKTVARIGNYSSRTNARFLKSEKPRYFRIDNLAAPCNCITKLRRCIRDRSRATFSQGWSCSGRNIARLKFGGRERFREDYPCSRVILFPAFRFLLKRSIRALGAHNTAAAYAYVYITRHNRASWHRGRTKRNIDCVSAALILSLRPSVARPREGEPQQESRGQGVENARLTERHEGKRLASGQACWTPRPGERNAKEEDAWKAAGRGSKIIATIPHQVLISQPTIVDRCGRLADANITGRPHPRQPAVCLSACLPVAHLLSRTYLHFSGGSLLLLCRYRNTAFAIDAYSIMVHRAEAIVCPMFCETECFEIIWTCVCMYIHTRFCVCKRDSVSHATTILFSIIAIDTH